MTQMGWQGHLNLTYTYHNQQTLITDQYSQAPLKIQRPFYPEDKEICHSIILHTAGGMVGGDRLAQQIYLKPHAKALLTTAAASKIYGSNDQPTQQTIVLDLAENAVLEWFPQENIIFNQANYQQSLQVNLAPTATLFSWEITRFGRTARGEQFTAGEWRSQTEIRQNGHPLWIDRQHLTGGEFIHSANSLKGCAVAGSFIYLGKSVNSQTIEQIRELWRNLDGKGQVGVTQSLGDGVICRYRGHSTAEARHWFVQIWHLLRRIQLQWAGIYPRIWLS